MLDEGYIAIQSRRHGAGAFLRKKQWWSFEGLDSERGMYFVFLAMQSFPTGFVSLTALDTQSGAPPRIRLENRIPDMDLTVTPLHMHRMVKKIPPLLPYIDIDYHEMLTEIQGEAYIRDATIHITGTTKYDHNFNRW